MDAFENVDVRWTELLRRLEEQIGDPLDEQGILYLIGLQELGKNYTRLSKDQKLDVIHIGVCTILTPFGYYEYKGRDDDGWPHWERLKKLPSLNGPEQEKLIRNAIVEYFQPSN